MIGIGGGCIIILMTSVTCRRRPGELSVHMTELAGDGSVRSGQRERCLRMVEGRGRPGCSIVASRTISPEL